MGASTPHVVTKSEKRVDCEQVQLSRFPFLCHILTPHKHPGYDVVETFRVLTAIIQKGTTSFTPCYKIRL